MMFKKIFDTLPKTGAPKDSVSEEPKEEVRVIEKLKEVGMFSNIGSRPNQQDSYGVIGCGDGIFAIVADGMGGLQDGEKVSQLIVKSMVEDSKNPEQFTDNRKLFQMLSRANRAVNEMLGPDNLYKSGSTVVAALIDKEVFSWISVGDSHIYLYRNNQLILLNREHVYETELYVQAVNGRIAFSDIHTDPQREGLTSFIGMGELRYVDGSYNSMPICKGDRLLLMSDGIYGTISVERMQEILNQDKDVQTTADLIGNEVVAMNRPGQDNMTLLVVELS